MELEFGQNFSWGQIPFELQLYFPNSSSLCQSSQNWMISTKFEQYTHTSCCYTMIRLSLVCFSIFFIIQPTPPLPSNPHSLSSIPSHCLFCQQNGKFGESKTDEVYRLPIISYCRQICNETLYSNMGQSNVNNQVLIEKICTLTR